MAAARRARSLLYECGVVCPARNTSRKSAAARRSALCGFSIAHVRNSHSRTCHRRRRRAADSAISSVVRCDAAARYLLTCTPAGVERHWARIAAEAAGVQPPDWALRPIPEVTIVGPQIAVQA